MNKWLKKKRRHRNIAWGQEQQEAKLYGKRSYNRKGKKNSKKLKAERIRNKKLCKRYPWLIPRNRWTDYISWVKQPYDHTELDDMPKGWRIAFGDIWCEEIDKAIRTSGHYNDFRVEQIKEKYGSLRTYFNWYVDKLDDVTNTFEVISEHVCARCGKLDVHVINDYGWYYPLCKECYEKGSINYTNRISYEQRLEEAGVDPEKKIPEQYTVNKFISRVKAPITEVHDISDTVQKIRHKNRRRNHE